MTSPTRQPAGTAVRLGLRENLAQFALLVVVNAFVGAMVGLERSILPAIAEMELSVTRDRLFLPLTSVSGQIWILDQVDR